MRALTLLNSVNANTSQLSIEVAMDQRVDWELIIEKIGTDGNPLLFIERAITSGGCAPLPVDWFVYPNKCTTDGSFLIEDDTTSIEKTSFKSNWFRVRTEPNGTTAGNLSVNIGYRMYT